MRIERWRAVAGAAVLAFATCAAADQPASLGPPGDAARITAIERQLAGETDATRALRYYAPDAVAVTVATPDWNVGTAQVRRALAVQLAGIHSIAPHLGEINVASDGAYACAASVIAADETLHDGSHRHTEVRRLDGLRMTPAGWRIVQSHVSVPVDMTTGQPLGQGPLAARGPLAWAPVAPAAPQTPGAAKAAILHWLEVNAVTPTIDEAMATYGPSDDVILFDVASPTEHRGLGELRSYFNSVLGGAASLQYKLPAVSIESDGKLGMQISRLDLRIVDHAGAVQFMSFRQSDCLRRIGDRWYPFFEMGSFPVDAASGKAIMAHPEAFTTAP